MFDPDKFNTLVPDDWGVMELYLDMMMPVLRYNHNGGTFMAYENGIWEPSHTQHEHAAMALGSRLSQWLSVTPLQDRDPYLVKSAKQLSTLAKARALASAVKNHRRIRADGKDWNPKHRRNLFTVANGTLDLNTGELLPWDPRHMQTRKADVTYLPQATGSRWDRFVEEVMPDPETRAYVQRALGYTITGDCNERVVFMLHGASGSGKSAFLEAIYQTLGTFAGVAGEATLLPRRDETAPNDTLHSLKGKRFVKMSETTQGNTLNENLLKTITGMDTQKTRPLYGQLEEWDVEFTIWMATNHLPRISASDDAVWMRVKPILFPGKFVDDNGSALVREDRSLGSKLAETEGPAILNWILQGLADYREHGLKEPATVAVEVAAYRDEVDSTRQFTVAAAEDGRIAVSDGLKCRSQELYRTYVAWCSEEHVRPVSNRTFSQRLLASGWVKTREAVGMMWHGIGLVQIGTWLGETQQPVRATWGNHGTRSD